MNNVEDLLKSNSELIELLPSIIEDKFDESCVVGIGMPGKYFMYGGEIYKLSLELSRDSWDTDDYDENEDILTYLD